MTVGRDTQYLATSIKNNNERQTEEYSLSGVFYPIIFEAAFLNLFIIAIPMALSGTPSIIMAS